MTKTVLKGLAACLLAVAGTCATFKSTPFEIKDAVYAGLVSDLKANAKDSLRFQKGTNIYYLVNEDRNFTPRFTPTRHPGVTWNVNGYSDFWGKYATQVKLNSVDYCNTNNMYAREK
ncbi:hypothetical protein KA107_03650 [Candidatus Pacearchaeota archaeon]|nr:hypothetical protein [Candidatus Pacearchaeota archaeon]